MTIQFVEDPEEAQVHGRYVLFYPDAPTLVNIDGLIGVINSDQHPDRLPGIVALDVHGGCEEVELEHDAADGMWIVKTLDGNVVEEVRYMADGRVEHHLAYVNGFTTDEVPTFQVGADR